MINPKKWKIRLNDGWELWENEKSSSFYNMLADEKLNSLTKKGEINKIGCARST